jgi:hypothetical protein
MSTHDPAEDLVEVYRTAAPLEADRVIVEVLEPAGIPCFRRDRISHALPAPDAQSGAYFVAVAVADAERARQLLEQARADQILDTAEGEIVRAS